MEKIEFLAACISEVPPVILSNIGVRCFKKLGELLQSRRKKELYDSHYLYIRDSDDPAGKDAELASTLKQNFTEGQIKIEKVCEEFVSKEERGEDPQLSEEDSDKIKTQKS
ncbi:hypothetical protein NQ318_021010 [Aromia moschata]|uniref:Daxx histone-binding domain-containing protein n=1 Tax=Aromia moschata TaxID=1265417 RepID=A0AAV8YPQ5_9CUCU|nr:hypothetical protein NQ318_021010 [Aromia moschata]